jgi:hypothetical protein
MLACDLLQPLDLHPNFALLLVHLCRFLLAPLQNLVDAPLLRGVHYAKGVSWQDAKI